MTAPSVLRLAVLPSCSMIDDAHVYMLGDCYAIEKTKEMKLPLGAELQDIGRNYEQGDRRSR